MENKNDRKVLQQQVDSCVAQLEKLPPITAES